MENNLRGGQVADSEQWYTNKDLFEQTQKLRDELKATQSIIKKYNGLYEKVGDIYKSIGEIHESLESQIRRCDEVQTTFKTKSALYNRLIQLWPIVISTLIFILSRFG